MRNIDIVHKNFPVLWLILLLQINLADLIKDSYRTYNGNTPGVANCSEKYFERQIIDHFNWNIPKGSDGTWPQRYFINADFWSKTANGEKGPIFFYVGNEANVEMYVNFTGLMWENAERFGALLIWAEV